MEHFRLFHLIMKEYLICGFLSFQKSCELHPLPDDQITDHMGYYGNKPGNRICYIYVLRGVKHFPVKKCFKPYYSESAGSDK